MNKLGFVFPILASALLGCTAQEPSALPSGPYDRDMAKSQVYIPDLANEPEVGAPQLAPIPGISNYLTVPIHGTAAAGTTILVDNTAAGTVSADVSSAGTFCIDVKINENTSTTISIHAISPTGKEGPAVEQTITHQPATEQGPAAPTPQNAALGSSAYASFVSDSMSNGVYTYVVPELTDGDMSTYAEGSAHWNGLVWGTNDIVYVHLNEIARVNRLVAAAAPDCPVTAPVKVLTSQSEAPGHPNSSPMEWLLVKDFAQNAFPADGEIKLGQNRIVRWVALSFDHGYGDEVTRNCGSFFSPYPNRPKYGFAEVQAWTVPNEAPPPPAEPSCTN